MEPKPVPERPAVRVLAFVPEGRRSPAADALTAAGCDVDVVSRCSEITGRIASSRPDALVVDFSLGETADSTESLIFETLATIPATGRPPRILVVDGSTPGEGAAPRADRRLGSDDIDQVVREVHGAAAIARLEDALAEVGRLRETVAFARSTAHDLAQPLTTILARSQLLMNTLKPEDPHYRAISIICGEAERLAGTADEFNKLKVMAATGPARRD